jgi:hypothetical protein
MTFKKQIESVNACGGTDFSRPLDHISQRIVREDHCK